MKGEICVVGGGPAGAAIARRLAQLGHDVVLVERQAFPRAHVGESLTPGILPLLDVLGVRSRVEEASFLRPTAALIRWGEDAPARREWGGVPGFQVDRGRFDEILLDAAARAGVRVLQPVAAGRPIRVHEGLWRIPLWRIPLWRSPLRGPAAPSELRARFLVDASGRRSTLSGGAARRSPPTLALYGYWHDVKIEGPETRIDVGPGQWYWGAPLPDGSFNAAVFLDPKGCACGARELEDRYRALLAESSLLRFCLEGRLAGNVPAGESRGSGVRACDASSRESVDSVGPDRIQVGEAAFSIDPLSSQGVQVALRTALQGAIVVHTLLAVPRNGSAAITFYRDRQKEAVERHLSLAGRFYAEAVHRKETFWRLRASAEPPPRKWPRHDVRGALEGQDRIRLSDHARLVEAPVLHGDTIGVLPALEHPSLERPVAFVAGQEIAPLVASLAARRDGARVRDLLATWPKEPGKGMELLRWMWEHGVIIRDS